MTTEKSSRPLIGEILLRRNLVTEPQLDEALAFQRKEKMLLGEALVHLGYIEEVDIVVALVVQCGLPYIAVNKYDITQDVLKLIPFEYAKKYNVIPLDRIGNVLSVVMPNPLSDEIKKELEQLTNCKIATFISTRTEIEEALNNFYLDK